jgi:hypothetical protein
MTYIFPYIHTINPKDNNTYFWVTYVTTPQQFWLNPLIFSISRCKVKELEILLGLSKLFIFSFDDTNSTNFILLKKSIPIQIFREWKKSFPIGYQQSFLS